MGMEVHATLAWRLFAHKGLHTVHTCMFQRSFVSRSGTNHPVALYWSSKSKLLQCTCMQALKSKLGYYPFWYYISYAEAKNITLKICVHVICVCIVTGPSMQDVYTFLLFFQVILRYKTTYSDSAKSVHLCQYCIKHITTNLCSI